MSTPPLTHGRNGNGQFARGNRLGRGNPLAGRAAKIRARLLDLSSDEDIDDICRALVDGAKNGDLAFIKEWFDRTAGKPSDILTEERISQLEAILERKTDEHE